MYHFVDFELNVPIFGGTGTILAMYHDFRKTLSEKESKFGPSWGMFWACRERRFWRVRLPIRPDSKLASVGTNSSDTRSILLTKNRAIR